MIETRLADKNDVMPILNLLINGMFQEVGKTLAPDIDTEKVAQRVWNLIQDGMVYVAMDQGQCIGSIALDKRRWWWAGSTFYGDEWFYVEPDYRSDAGKGLLAAVRQRAESEGIRLFVHVFNSKRAKGRVSEMFEVRPSGYLVAL